MDHHAAARRGPYGPAVLAGPQYWRARGRRGSFGADVPFTPAPPSVSDKLALWLRLRAYRFDHLVPPHLWDHVVAAFGSTDASTLAFANKLARKLGWSSAFARRAIEEYRKFVYLGVVSDFSVTPSKVIDQLWHEHLLFTRAYREFCRDVLKRDFDHNPELVPSGEQIAVYEAQYQATLDLYHREFHVAPPAAFWSIPKFNTDPARRRASNPPAHDAVASTTADTDPPLYLSFDGQGGIPSRHDMAEFGGGDGYAGAGGGSDWSGDSSDSGSSDGGGSSCSSGCGGD